MATLKNTLIDDTGYLQLPTGTTAQRPSSPSDGYMRYNTTESEVEVYSSGQWKSWSNKLPYEVDYLIIGGGGGGGGSTAGGGGAGGLRTSYGSTSGGGTASESTKVLEVGQVYTITIGAGGVGSRKNDDGAPNNTNGGSSTFDDIVSIGGGYGFSGSPSVSRVANTGGSGGGGGYYSGNSITAPSSIAGASGTVGQGYNGGDGVAISEWGGAGGGGAAGIGANQNSTRQGGIGLQSSITGVATYYAGGGGGGAHNADGNTSGGNGGGGQGGTGQSSIATSGTANTGGGGGGSGFYQYGPNPSGGNGGSGVILIRMLTSDYSGTTTGSPTVLTDGNYTILKFTTSGTYTA